MVRNIYKRCGRILVGKPFLLWGLSLLGGLLTFLAWIFGCLPIISFPIVLTLEAGMAMIYLDGYREKQVNSDQLFIGFKNFWHVAGGMAWRSLWKAIWGSIFSISVLLIIGATGVISALSFLADLRNAMPGLSYLMRDRSVMGGGASVGLFLICIVFGILAIAGCVFYVIKLYSYRFTPYILMEKPEISSTEALRQSMKMTKGHKGTLFLADMLLYVALFLAGGILAVLSMIPVIGAVFGIVLAVLQFVIGIVLPLFLGLVRAGLYIEISQGRQGRDEIEPFRQESTPPQKDNPVGTTPAFCKKCGAPLKPGQKFCTKCGTPV